MQRTMSNNLCEVPMKRSIRGKRRIHPRRSAYLRQIWSTRSCVRVNPCWKSQQCIISQNDDMGYRWKGNLWFDSTEMKSSSETCECLWLSEYKPCTSIGGARSEKIRDQIHKDSYPELGCSGDLSLVVIVHPVNVGTSCFGRKWTGQAAVEVKHEGRNSRSSRGYGKHITWRRAVANRKSLRK